MGERVPQIKSNHVRFDPLYHYVLAPVLGLLLVWTIIHLVRNPESTSVMLLIIVALMLLMALKSRLYPLRVQDRVIRLEERLRLSTLLPEPLRSHIGELSESQLTALRFAPDAEIPTLVERVISQKLSAKQIKDEIHEWRPDYWRV